MDTTTQEHILNELNRLYPEACCELIHKTPFQLLVATILAAQCTDQRVNQVTPLLFRKYPTPKQMVKANREDLIDIIRSTGFFNNKVKSLVGCSQTILSEHHGQVPESMEELTALPGVGRKTANVIRSHCFKKPAIIVDTHFKRVTYRLGFTRHTDPDKIEYDIQQQLPENRWSLFSHQITWHGRRVCGAKKPECNTCSLLSFCPFGTNAFQKAI
jgi:endonuclease III